MDAGDALYRVADAITPNAAADGQDAMGGNVGSLTEAVMGMTGALLQIANAIESLAEAQRSAGE